MHGYLLSTHLTELSQACNDPVIANGLIIVNRFFEISIRWTMLELKVYNQNLVSPLDGVTLECSRYWERI